MPLDNVEWATPPCGSFLGLFEVVVVAPVLGEVVVVLVSSPSDLSSFCDSPADEGTAELSIKYW